MASDLDSGQNANLTFKAVDLDETFQVKANGELWANKPLKGLNQTFTFNLQVRFELVGPCLPHDQRIVGSGERSDPKKDVL